METRETTKATPVQLIVLLAFTRNEEGDVVPAMEPREMRDASTAIRTAKQIAGDYVGVIAWSRSADLVNGEFGEPVTLISIGDVPDME